MLVLTLAALQMASAPLRLDTAQCRAGTAHPVTVRISGFANRAGRVRVRLFGGSPATYFDKRKALVRTELAVPRTGPVEICVPAPRAGIYAVDVRHDVNGDGKTDRQDGGGASGNPRVSLLDMLLSRKPDTRSVQFSVGTGNTVVPVTLMYLQGGSVRPVSGAN
jgi:uncharacterized protein (DUF2141 family)